MAQPEAIPAAPAPWPNLKADVYLFSVWISPAQVKKEGLPPHAYSPLEAASDYARPAASGSPVGGLGMVQVLRYSETPVGPYDELIVLPGSFEWSRPEDGAAADGAGAGAGGRARRGRDPRISRIYVSQKHTCYNGRVNWNVPKHLARFDWSTNPDGSTSVKVFPHDTTAATASDAAAYDAAEASPSPVPFFQGTFKPMRFLPAFPFSTDWLSAVGVSTALVLPPLPAGRGSQGELPGTGDRWCRIQPRQRSPRTVLGWFDVAQHRDEGGRLTGLYDNFWPGIGRWQVGIKMEDSHIAFPEPETWTLSSSSSTARL